jgi:uncharacterized membrane protein YeiB
MLSLVLIGLVSTTIIIIVSILTDYSAMEIVLKTNLRSQDISTLAFTAILVPFLTDLLLYKALDNPEGLSKLLVK